MLIQKILSNHSAPTHEDNCMLWLNAKNLDGYGHVKYNGRTENVHRIVWSYYHGPIPEGMCVCHTCDNPSCINPDHLFVGTRADNSRDMVEKGRQARGSKHTSTHLTDIDVISIRASYASGARLRVLAEQYSVSISTMWKIVTGKYWSHLPGASKTRRGRLSKSAMEEIRSLNKRGLTPTEIARKLNRPYSTVYNVVARNRRVGT